MLYSVTVSRDQHLHKTVITRQRERKGHNFMDKALISSSTPEVSMFSDLFSDLYLLHHQ